MSFAMGPPMPAGYSLRVQLFAPNAHGLGDAPIRNFRVVTSPDVTVRDFCQEASRIHEINYGEPLIVKKVTDEEGFDITQTEILGSLFTTAARVRIIQASSNSSMRDSVPPTSALRFDPNANRKRRREGSVKPTDPSLQSPWKPSKRQRISSHDPDEPLPSREAASDVAGPSKIQHVESDGRFIPVPDFFAQNGQNGPSNARSVRGNIPMIPETPSPEREIRAISRKQHSADTQNLKSAKNKPANDSSFSTNEDRSSPPRSIRAQSHVPSSNAKNATYHIHKATERGRSVSTAATSPLSFERQTAVIKKSSQPASRKEATPQPSKDPVSSRRNGKKSVAQDEQSIYENIVSDEEMPTTVKKAKNVSSRSTDSPRDSRPVARQDSVRAETPIAQTKRGSYSREKSTPTELPLTPGSDERKKQQKQKELDDRTKARAAAAAAKAAEIRKEAEETRVAEELRIAEQQRLEREEQERLDVEEFNRAEAERQAIVERTARLQAEREEREKAEAGDARKREAARLVLREAEEKRQREEARLAKEKRKEEARLAEAKREEQERVAKQKAEEKAARLEEAEAREEEARKEQERKVLEQEEREKKEIEAKDAAARKARLTKSISPAVARPVTPAPKPQPSSTSFFPSGRKSSLKPSSLRSSSPAVQADTLVTASYVIESHAHASGRKVSFDEQSIVPPKETRILPPARKILPPPKPKSRLSGTPEVITSSSTPSKPLPSQSSRAKSAPPTRKSTTPPEDSTKTGHSARSSPDDAVDATPTQKSIIPISTRQTITPIPGPKPFQRASTTVPSSLPSSLGLRSSTKKSDPSPKRLVKYGKASARLKKAALDNGGDSAMADEDSQEESEADVSEELPARISSLNTTIKYDPSEPVSDDESEKEDPDETQSRHSSSRDGSRSPVMFSQFSKISHSEKATQPVIQQDEDSSVEGDSSDDESSHSKEASKPVTNSNSAVSKAALSEDVESSSDEEEDPKIQVPRSSPPELPKLPGPRQLSKPIPKAAAKPSPPTSKPSLSESSFDTQDEVDQQLISSLYEAQSVPASSTRQVPASSALPKSRLSFGASLKSLNASSQAAAAQAKLNGSRPVTPKPQLVQEDEHSEEEDSDSSDSSSSSEDEAPVSTTKPKLPFVHPTKAATDSSDDSDSSSDSENVDDQEQNRKDLLRQIEALSKMDSSASQDQVPSPKAYRSSTQGATQNKKEKSKKVDKYLSGYTFSAPA